MRVPLFCIKTLFLHIFPRFYLTEIEIQKADKNHVENFVILEKEREENISRNPNRLSAPPPPAQIS